MNFADLKSQFPDTIIEANHPLAPYTTLKIGGPADIFINTKSTDEFIKVLSEVSKLTSAADNFSEHSEREVSEPESSEHRKNSSASGITILGNGSNVLISDSGIRGLVIKNSSTGIEILNDISNPTSPTTYTSTVLRQESNPDQYLNFTKLDYDESNLPQTLVKVDNGVSLPILINWTLDHGFTGLQWFGYIPGSIGGAIWCNIHGGKHNLNEYLETITVFDLETGATTDLFASQFKFGYDYSEFQDKPNLIIISATFKLYRGDIELAKNVKNAWITQKAKVQPMNSAGSVFKNPPLEICQKLWGEQKSTGWIIDTQLNLKNKQIGQIMIGPQHANIFTNLGGGTAADYKQLVDLVISEAKTKFNLELEPEIKFLG